MIWFTRQPAARSISCRSILQMITWQVFYACPCLGQRRPQTGLADLDGAAIIREVHVYGQSLPVGGDENGAAQHSGLGRRLIEEAERIAHQAGFQRLAVIAAIGTRPYYLRLGFERGDRYLIKRLAEPGVRQGGNA